MNATAYNEKTFEFETREITPETVIKVNSGVGSIGTITVAEIMEENGFSLFHVPTYMDDIVCSWGDK